MGGHLPYRQKTSYSIRVKVMKKACFWGGHLPGEVVFHAAEEERDPGVERALQEGQGQHLVCVCVGWGVVER